MADFELAFGVTLFERLAKGMALTPAGEALLHHARVTLLNIEKIAVELTEYSQGVRGHVRMLANLSAIVQFLPEDLSGFFNAHEFLKVDLQERPSGQVVRGIEEGAAEIGICAGEAETRSLEIFHYRYDNLVLVVRPDHPLAARDRLLFADTLDFDHIGLHAASSIYLMSQYAATQAGKSMRLHPRSRFRRGVPDGGAGEHGYRPHSGSRIRRHRCGNEPSVDPAARRMGAAGTQNRRA
jgi:DNA-binding transcriptional LysR family regulator